MLSDLSLAEARFLLNCSDEKCHSVDFNFPNLLGLGTTESTLDGNVGVWLGLAEFY